MRKNVIKTVKEIFKKKDNYYNHIMSYETIKHIAALKSHCCMYIICHIIVKSFRKSRGGVKGSHCQDQIAVLSAERTKSANGLQHTTVTSLLSLRKHSRG